VPSLIRLKALDLSQPTGGHRAGRLPPRRCRGRPRGDRGANWGLIRYCWLRDATITLRGRCCAPGTPTRPPPGGRGWPGPVAGDPRDVQIMYGWPASAGWTSGTEWLPANENSAPVRIGNAAVNQRQLDVYGEVIDALSLGRATGVRAGPARLGAAARPRCSPSWRSTGTSRTRESGRFRGPRRHFVHSKVMAWVAFDRAVRAVQAGMSGPADRWQASGTRFNAEVLEKGYDEKRGAFMQYYGSSQLDRGGAADPGGGVPAAG